MSFDSLFGGPVYRSLPTPTTSSTPSLDPFSSPWDKPVFRNMGFPSDSEFSSPQLFNQPRIRTMSTAPGTGVPFSSPSTLVPDVPKDNMRSLSGGPNPQNSPLSLENTTSFVSRSPGIDKLFQTAANSSNLSLALNTPSSLPKQVSMSVPMSNNGGTNGLSMPTLNRKTSTSTPDHKIADPRTVWASFRQGAMFVRCIVHPVHIHYLLCNQISSNEWQVIELNGENRKKMILGQPLKRGTYVFNEKHKIELCSLGELNTLMPSVKPRTFGSGSSGSSDFEGLDDLPGFSEDLDLRMTLSD